MKTHNIIIALTISFFVSACSSTVLNESWKNPDYTKRIDSVYIVGVAKNESSRRIFEDTFKNSLSRLGVRGDVSYKDFTSNEKAGKDDVLKVAKNHGAQTILMTRLVKKRTETVVNPGRVMTYSTGSTYYPSPYYSNYGTYYPRRYETIYEPPTVNQYEIAIIESNIFETASGELVWGARLETTVGGNHQKIINDFIKVVTKDLQAKGLL